MSCILAVSIACEMMVSCSVWQCVEACCSALQCAAACCGVFGRAVVCCSELQCVASLPYPSHGDVHLSS